VLQRLFAIALGFADLNDYNELRHDPVLAALNGKQLKIGALVRLSVRRAKIAMASAYP
jgi:hypothetical protein